MSIIFVVLNNQLAKYAEFHMTYNDITLVLEIFPLHLVNMTSWIRTQSLLNLA